MFEVDFIGNVLNTIYILRLKSKLSLILTLSWQIWHWFIPDGRRLFWNINKYTKIQLYQWNQWLWSWLKMGMISRSNFQYLGGYCLCNGKVGVIHFRPISLYDIIWQLCNFKYYQMWTYIGEKRRLWSLNIMSYYNMKIYL